MGGTELLDLPEELIRIIFSKLPLKPLIVCRCVSPQWRRMMSDINFCNYYHKLGVENKTLGSRLLVFTDYGIDSISLEDLRADNISNRYFSTRRRLHCPFKEHRSSEHVQLLGTCNGLVFVDIGLYSPNNLYVWNPSTGFFLKLPDPPKNLYLYWNRPSTGLFIKLPNHPKFYCGSGVWIQHCGFGYVSVTNDYKAVVTMSEYKLCDHEPWKHVLVYSVTNQTWIRVEYPYNNVHYYARDMRGILVNEKLHWQLGYFDSDPCRVPTGWESYEGVIVVFDLAEHKFSKIQFPPISFDENSSIGVSEGCLCLLVHDYFPDHFVNIDLWVMKEDDDVMWTKQLSINMPNDLPNQERLIKVKRVCLRFVMESSIVITIECFGVGDMLLIIDTKQGKIEDFPANRRYLSLLKDPVHEYTHATVYQETPIFLKN